MRIGVLSVQGDVAENILSLKTAMTQLGIDGTIINVKSPDEISDLDGIVIPGGESTTMGQMSLVNNSAKILKEKIANGMPALGICAGMILLSKGVNDKNVGKTGQPLYEILDIKVQRNSFGRQSESFEADITLDSLGIAHFNGVFIRAPSVTEVGDNIKILSKFNDKIIAVQQNNIIGVSFHPELTKDVSLHKYFINLVKH